MRDHKLPPDLNRYTTMLPMIHNTTDWANSMFGNAQIGDTRRTNRLIDIASRLADNTGRSAAYACDGQGSLVEGTYRFIRNEKVDASAFRRAAFDTTAALAVDRDEVWLMEDTTSLSFKHGVAMKLGKLGKTTDKARGWWVHNSFMIDAETGCSLGLVHQEWWMRPDEADDTTEPESGKWAAASASVRRRFGDQMYKVITVCDREADIFAYLQEKTEQQERFVVRAKHHRHIEQADARLFTHLAEQPELGRYQLDIPQKGMLDSKGKRKNRKARTAEFSLHTTPVTFSQSGQKITLNAVFAQEQAATDDEANLCWLLLTSEPVETYKQAMKVIHIYSQRWRVEDYHKAWKTGAGAERQRMTEPENLERMVSILAFVGVRLMQLRESLTLAVQLKARGSLEQAEAIESQPCTNVLTEDEWRILWLNANKRGGRYPKKLPNEIPTLKWAYQAIGKLGGFYDSKRTGIASWATMWLGWDKLQDMLSGYYLSKETAALMGF